LALFDKTVKKQSNQRKYVTKTLDCTNKNRQGIHLPIWLLYP